MKQCTTCGYEKELSEFPFRNKNADIRNNVCKACKGKYHKEYRSLNRDSLKIKKHEYYKTQQASKDEIKLIKSTKFCRVCAVEKSLDQFYSPSGRSNYGKLCRICRALAEKTKYWDDPEKHKAKLARSHKHTRLINKYNIWKYLQTHPCVDCGENDPLVLEFDHVRDKSKEISYLVEKCTWTKVEEEIEKCEVRCVNCHRRKTTKQLGWSKINLYEEFENGIFPDS